ncbi:ATP-binding protein [Acidicapsa ligni]|uniref:ATP-binding protein n=1 Tax=Acidicapsa ligni TaxID=542300 RepID=UPI0021E0B640|nr:helix-turn-helix transcriptional regulator [Acidicapsa ligni]
MQKDRKYSFGSFELLPERGVLLCDDVPIPLGSRAIKILTLLVERAGEVVTGQELIDYAWPDTPVVESNVRVHLANIRKHLVAATGETNAILTIPGQGYQFNLAVEAHRTTARQRIRSSLPNLWTALIGRENAIERLLHDISAHRFVTLVGSGGIGKTSVALAAGHKAASCYEDGAVFVDFTTMTTRHMLMNRLASALRLPLTSSDQETSVLECLHDRETLLIFDNCEHVLEESAYLAEQVLRSSPGSHLLVTSREPLQAESEFVVRLPSLDYPPADGKLLTASEALTYPAVRLFVERAQASQAWFELQDEDAPGLALLCRRLDGIPLAIELAAARIELFNISTLTQQLDRSLHLLTKGRRTAPERQRTLRATLDWSYGLLSQGEHLLLARLSVFQNAFDREAALAVTSDEVMTEARILDGVTSLAAKSLIVTSREGPLPLYRLLEATREYALEKLGAGPATHSLRKRHATYLRDLTRRLEPQNGFVTSAGLDRYRRLADELRAAMMWAFSVDGDAELGADLAAVSAYIWFQISLPGEYQDIADRALASMKGKAGSREAELEILLAKGPALFEALGAVPELYSTSVRALELATQLEDNAGVVCALLCLWRYHYGLSNYEESLHVTEQLRLQAETGHDPGAMYLIHAMLSLLYLGRLSEASERAAEVARRISGDTVPLRNAYSYDARVIVLASTARLLWLQGFSEAASERADEAVELALEARHSTTICFALGMAGCPIKLWTGQFASAERHIALLQEYAKAANSTYWQNYVAVFSRGLPLSELRQSTLARQNVYGEAGWDPRHWESISVLGQGFAPPHLLERAKRDRCWWCAPEILRLEAMRFIVKAEPCALSRAEQLLEQALSIAEEQGALQWRLRINMSIAHLWSNDARLPSALQQLDATVNEFTEGFDFPDLLEATALLEKFACSR